MKRENIKMIVFDLDGTLAPSKSRIDDDMALLLIELMKNYKVAVITGGDFPQFEKQIIPFLGNDSNVLENFYICPTCSSKMYIYKNNNWNKLYSQDLSSEEKEKIFYFFNKALNETGFKPEKVWGEIIEDRGTQITFSALGQQAPLEEKTTWDPDFKKRIEIKKILDNYLQEFSVKIGGSTSIDITKNGIDKAYGIKKLSEMSNIKTEEMIFIGDAIFEGGNDFPATTTGAECIKTSGVEETKKIIKDLI